MFIGHASTKSIVLLVIVQGKNKIKQLFFHMQFHDSLSKKKKKKASGWVYQSYRSGFI